MSRQISRDQMLSREDRQYLEERGDTQTIAFIDQNYPPDYDPNTPETPEVALAPTVAYPYKTPLSEYSTDELEEELERREAEADEDDEDGVDYDQMTVDELRQELGRRQDADGKPLPTSGSKPALVSRLREHDAASQANPEA